MITVAIFEILERVPNALYYVYKTRKGKHEFTLGFPKSINNGESMIKTYCKKHNIENYITKIITQGV